MARAGAFAVAGGFKPGSDGAARGVAREQGGAGENVRPSRFKVGFFVSSLSDMGGAVRVAVSLANRMADDYDVTVFELVDRGASAFGLSEAVTVCSLNARGARIRDRIPEVRALLASALSDHPCDVLLGIGVEETTVAVRPCRDRGVPLVFCDHGALINQLDDRSTTLLRFACSVFCAKTVVLTTQTLADYRRMFKTPARKLECIPNWIDEALYRNAPFACMESKSIVWAGRLDKEKGPDKLFDIAKRLASGNSDWHIDVYGARVLSDEGFDLEKAVEEEGLSPFVRLCGRYSDVSEVFPRYSVGILTSYREGLPLFLLEGMAFGLPLVSFDVDTGPRDLIDDGVTGFLVEPYDCDAYAAALQTLMDDEGLRERMSLAARDKAKDFLERNVYPIWQRLIGELAKGGRR